MPSSFRKIARINQKILYIYQNIDGKTSISSCIKMKKIPH